MIQHMAHTLTPLLLLILFCASAAGARPRLYSVDGQNGICKSMVDIQGYSCEEHKVRTILKSSMLLNFTNFLLDYGVFIIY